MDFNPAGLKKAWEKSIQRGMNISKRDIEALVTAYQVAIDNPCKGFAYMGQPLSGCDNCGEPFWKHSHVQVFKPDVPDIFTPGMDVWDYEPISESSKIRVKNAFIGANREKT